MKNWAFIPFESAIQKVTYTKKIPRRQYLADGTYPIISQESDFINGYWDNAEDVFSVDSPVVIFGDHTKIIKHIDFDFVLGADGVKILKPIETLSSKFFAYFLNAAPVADLGYARHYRLLKEITVPVPPREEQERIVAILDEVFADIEQVRAKTEQNLKNARELFESYLQQVFSKDIKNYNQVALAEITKSISDGDHSAPPKSSEGIPFITISNIGKNTNEIDFSSTFKVPEDYYEKLKPNRKPIAGDVLYTVTGSYGIPVLVKKEKKFCFQRHIGLIRPNSKTESEWLYYLLMSPIVFKQAEEGATGTAQKTVSLKVLRNILVPETPLDIQKEEVKKLKLVDAKTKNLESVYSEKLAALDELKKSILQKAFSGELTQKNNQGAVA
jgi:type I restriction enzyme S subunit